MTEERVEEICWDIFKNKCLEFGWDDAIVTDPLLPKEDSDAYANWIKNRSHADLHYMENDQRLDLQKIFPGTVSVVVLLTAYKKPSQKFQKNCGLIASYARGKDYHHLHRKRLKKLIRWIEAYVGRENIAKGFSDTAPVMEKALAAKGGLGWFGKNTLLIHRKFGTYTLLSGLLSRIKIVHHPQPILKIHFPRCGLCTRCIDACPTQALSPYHLDANRCLSYHLIESKSSIPLEIQNQNPGYIFGCDICQDVCPHNIKAPEHSPEELLETAGIGSYISLETLNLIKQNPTMLFGTPLQRRGVTGLADTFQTILNKQGVDERSSKFFYQH